MKKFLLPALVFAIFAFPSAAWCGGTFEATLRVTDARYLFNDPAAASRNLLIVGTVLEVASCAPDKETEKKALTCPKKGDVLHFPYGCAPQACPALLKAKVVKIGGPMPSAGADNNQPKTLEIVE